MASRMNTLYVAIPTAVAVAGLSLLGWWLRNKR